MRKSVSTNFKLHKRKSTDEEEQYVFYNTHEPIISQELWDSVQRRRQRANRTAARGTHTNRLKEVKATEMILEMLKDGEMLTSECEEKLEAAGFKKSTIKKAKMKAGALSKKAGFQWYWYLPVGDKPNE